MMLMYRVASSPLVLALAMAVVPHRATAQYAGDPTASRAPRFLLAMAERSQPVPVDLKRSAFLRRPLSLAFDGATVSVVGTRLSAETDVAGRYSVSAVPVGTQRLRARMLGFAPADTSVVVEEGKETVVDLQLKAQAIELEAVVAVGYGEKKRENLTGAVASVGSEVHRHDGLRSEEHTSELQSHSDLVCRLL